MYLYLVLSLRLEVSEFILVTDILRISNLDVNWAELLSLDNV